MPRGRKRKGWEDYAPPLRDEATGCLRWTGPHHTQGYGKIGDLFAHRVAYEKAHGPIPEGHQVDHVQDRGCAYRDCVEPNHLEAVTQTENVLRQKNVQDQIARTHCPQGHPYSGENLIVRRGKRECRTCTYARNTRNRERRKKNLGRV